MTPSGDPVAALSLRRLRFLAGAFFAVLLTVSAAVNALTVLSNRARLGDFISPWQPFCWEFSSAAMIGVLIPALVWLYARLPLTRRTWKWALPLHAAATLPFSIVHVAGMVGLRKLVYAAAGLHYDFGPVVANWLYEYRKDAVTYVMILAILFGFRSYRLARMQAPADEAATPDPGRTPAQRLVSRKFGREFVVNVADVDRVEANGNYVTLYAQGSAYPLRESLASLERRLDSRRFLRVHRSHLVNVDRVREIRPWASGDYRIVLADGSEVKLSRRYRARLGAVFGG